MGLVRIPETALSSGSKMPALGLGTATKNKPEVIQAAIQAIEAGYRHFDTGSLYLTEGPLGEAIAEALRLGLIKSRDELFITSKLWCNDAHGDLVLPALQKSLKNLKLDYLDLYLVHWPVSMKPGPPKHPPGEGDLLPYDIKAVWTAMEECQKLGLAKSIGVSNHSCKKLAEILSFCKIPPAVNQVEMNPVWQQKKQVEFCKANGIVVTAYSPLSAAGNFWGSNRVLESEVLKGIATARGKTVAQVSLRWLHEQGVAVIVKSFKKERMKENLEIFDWALTIEDLKKISEIPQHKANPAAEFTSPNGPIKSVEELWDGEI